MPSSSNVDTRIVFDRATGEILHVHQSLALLGAQLPDDEELAASALSFAADRTNRSQAEMDVLRVNEEDLRVGVNHKVDPKARCLVIGE